MPKGHGKGSKGRGKGRGKGKAKALGATELSELERCRKLRAEATNMGRGPGGKDAGKGVDKGGSAGATVNARGDAMPVFRPTKLWLTDKQEDFILETLGKLLETSEDSEPTEEEVVAQTEDFVDEDNSTPNKDGRTFNADVHDDSDDDHWEDDEIEDDDEALLTFTDSKGHKYILEDEESDNESDDDNDVELELRAFAVHDEVGDDDCDEYEDYHDVDDGEIDGRPCARIHEQEKQAAEVVAREQRTAKRMLLRKLIEADRSEAAAQAAQQRKAEAARQAKRWAARFNHSSGNSRGLQGLNPDFQPALKAGAAVGASPDLSASDSTTRYNAFDALPVYHGGNAASGAGGSSSGDVLNLGSTVRASLFADSIGKKGHQGPPKVAVLSRQMSLADLLRMAKGKLGLKRKAELVVAEWPRFERSDRSANKSSGDAKQQLPPHLHFEAYCLGSRSDEDAKLPLLLLPDGVRLRVIDRKSDADLCRAELKFAERSEHSTRRLRKNFREEPAEDDEDDDDDASSAAALAVESDGAVAAAAAEAAAANEAALIAQAQAVKAHYAQDASNRRKRGNGSTSATGKHVDEDADNFNQEMLPQEASDLLRTQRTSYFMEGAAKRRGHPNFNAMMAARAELPAWNAKNEVLNAVARSQVVVVCGATGCGKSTQIPQFLVDAFVEQQQGLPSEVGAAGDGALNSRLRPPRMVITQPRRVAALALAKRVADERCEQLGGGEVGYQVRLDRRVDRKKGAIEFVTVGVLLRRLGDAATANSEAEEAAAAEHEGEVALNDLESSNALSEDVDDLLNGLTHIVVDEVHERDVLADFLLIVLRDLLATRPHLKLILMSATVDASRFADYFGNATPVVQIPGRTFPIAQKYLTDVQKLFPKAIPGLSLTAAEKARSAKQQTSPRAAEEVGQTAVASSTRAAVGAASALPPLAVAVSPSVSKPEADASIKALGGFVAELIKQRVKDMATPKGGDGSSSGSGKAVGSSKGGAAADVHGAILVFLPGAGEIDQAMRETRMALGEDAGKGGKGGKGSKGKGSKKGGGGGSGKGTRNRDAFDSSPGWLLPLHGALPLRDQRRAFQEATPNKVKVVFATNVAETSITIPDVDTVVDSGFVKEIRYDPIASLPKLETVWVSQAAAQQRSGRAGRVRPGTAYRMYDLPWFEGTSSSSSGSSSRGSGGGSGGGSGSSNTSSNDSGGMLRYTVPEMVRTPLEELVLQTQLLELGAPNKFLSKALDPPERRAVNAAVRSLLELGALRIKHTTGTAIARGGAAELPPNQEESDKNSSDGLAGSKSSADGSIDGNAGTEGAPDGSSSAARNESGLAVELTSLGHHVARLPLAPKLAKLLVLGALFGVPEEALTIAACLSEKPAFAGPYDKRDEVRRAKCKLADGFSSDHVAALNAYLGWKHAACEASHASTPEGKAKAAAVARALENAAAIGGGVNSNSNPSNKMSSDAAPESPWQAQRSFCRLYWLSESTLVAVDQLREQYRRLLCNAGFIAPSSGYYDDDDDDDNDDDDDDDKITAENSRGSSATTPVPSRNSWVSSPSSPSPPQESMPAKTATLVTSLLAAALCPAGVARVLRPTKNLGGKRGGGSGNGGTCYTRTERVLMHPGSVNARLLSDASSSHGRVSGPDGFLCFFAKQATASSTHPYLLDSSLVSPLAVLLFGGDLDVRRVPGRVADGEGGQGYKKKRHAKDQLHKQNTRCHVAVVGTGLAFEMPETAAVLVKVLRRALEEQLAASIAQPAWLNARSHQHDAKADTAGSGQLGQAKPEKAQRKAQLVLDATAEFLKLGTGGNNF